MQIRCPSCKTKARVKDSMEGARVRCGECGREYRAREPVASASQAGRMIALSVGGGVLALVLLFVYTNRNSSSAEVRARRPEPTVAAPAKAPVEDHVGWDSPSVRAVRALYRAAQESDETFLRSALLAERLSERESRNTGGATEHLDAAQELELALAELQSAESDENLVAWTPYDGTVIASAVDEVKVRLRVKKEDGEARTIDWRLARQGRTWKAFSWERRLSATEARALYNAQVRARRDRVEEVHLSDGSRVFEAEPGPMEHFEDTPPELRERIDALFLDLIDIHNPDPKICVRARGQLAEIGKPALPVLLTALYDIPIFNEDQSIQVGLVNRTLEDITGHYTGYRPQIVGGRGALLAEERRLSAIRQWFAWWWRHGERFEERERIDIFEGVIEPTERDLRDMRKED